MGVSQGLKLIPTKESCELLGGGGGYVVSATYGNILFMRYMFLARHAAGGRVGHSA